MKMGAYELYENLRKQHPEAVASFEAKQAKEKAYAAELAAYRSTSLTPEEVQQLADAKAEGRLVVLPEAEIVMALNDWFYCFNDMVFNINSEKSMKAVLKWGVRQFFGTPEEAEAALKERGASE